MLAIMIGHAKYDGHIVGVIPHLVEGELSILQYVGDTILFIEHDIENTRNMQLILSAFEQLSGIKLIFIRANCFVSMRLKTRPNILPSYLATDMIRFLLGIWIFRFISEDSQMPYVN
jgi:hypothetical protein